MHWQRFFNRFEYVIFFREALSAISFAILLNFYRKKKSGPFGTIFSKSLFVSEYLLAIPGITGAVADVIFMLRDFKNF